MAIKIIEVSAEAYELKFKSTYQNARVVTPNNRYVRVQVKSGECIGIGEVSPMPGYSAETSLSITEAVNRWLGPAVLGRDAFDCNEIDHRLARTLPDNWYAKAALDMALWDLRARSLNVSAAALFGGKARDEVPIGAVIALSDPESMARDAAVWLKRGARFFQCKIAEDERSSVARLSAIREAVGRDVEIAVDGNASFSLIAARRTVEAITQFDIKYFEQPLPRYELDGLATLVREAPFPIVADESLHSAMDAMRLCDRKAANGFNVKLSKSGISESRRIIAIAEAAGIPYGLGTMFESKRGTLASVQFAASIPSPFYPTEAVGPWMVEDPEDVPGLQLAEGTLAWKVPTGPGWGYA
ncbi:mandelate racemase/muconate lactonizing enzyme family protein [Castellaniella sp. S9]|uniref:mandelate racemase/muconate lactonizing enzyme family protein n=1 Tax=Castellaniella sp. S9 TaxID=2993652 RepID=UPI0022B5624E|nr:enolase C-terminal domain-like protein [Castellaniella sp. S9]